MAAAVNIGISNEDRAAIVAGLNKVLADAYAVYLKTHGYHWNVRGPNFSSLHTLFMTQYTEMWTAIDLMMRPRGMPPMPSARSSPSEPDGITAICSSPPRAPPRTT